MREFLFNPIVSEEKKKEVLKSLAKEAGLTDYTLSFLSLLVDRDRLVAAEEIFTAFENEYCKLTETQVCTANFPDVLHLSNGQEMILNFENFLAHSACSYKLGLSCQGTCLAEL